MYLCTTVPVDGPDEDELGERVCAIRYYSEQIKDHDVYVCRELLSTVDGIKDGLYAPIAWEEALLFNVWFADVRHSARNHVSKVRGGEVKEWQK